MLFRIYSLQTSEARVSNSGSMLWGRSLDKKGLMGDQMQIFVLKFEL